VGVVALGSSLEVHVSLTWGRRFNLVFEWVLNRLLDDPFRGLDVMGDETCENVRINSISDEESK
jgi:hypothetical protein